MRPISVTLCLFGSYKNTTQINFDNLNQKLFLIFGATGSGKTTLFDAITFALYGKGSGSLNAREGAVFQSRCDEFKNTPYVKFVFEEKGKIYEIYRSPAHHIDGNKNDNPEKLSLTLPDGKSFLGKKKEIQAEIHKIIGLDYNQFMKVAMIAQSEFVKVINERTSEKKLAFRMLFGTAIYDEFINKLKARKANVDEDIKAVTNECVGIVTGVSIPTDIENYAEVEDLRQKILSGNLGQLEEFIEALSIIISSSEIVRENLSNESLTLHKKRDTFIVEKTEAENIISAFNALSVAKEKLKELETIEGTIISNKDLADKIIAAFDIKKIYDLKTSAEKSLEEQRLTLDELKSSEPVIREKLNNNQCLFDELDKTATEELSKFSTIEEDFKKTKDQFIELEKLSLSTEKIENEIGIATSELKKSEEDLNNFELEVESKRELSKSLTGKTVELSKKETELVVISGFSSRLKDIHSELDKIERSDKVISEKFATHMKLAEKADELFTNYKKAQERKQHSIYGIIARDLKEGCTCPVCGNIFHSTPNPLENEEDANIDLDSLLKEYNEASTKAIAVFSEYETLKKHRDEAYADAIEKLISLKHEMSTEGFDITDDTLIETLDELVESKITSISETMIELKKAKSELESVNKFLDNADRMRIQLKQSYEECQRNVNKLQEELINIKATVEAINPKYSSLEEVQVVFEEAKKRKEDADMRKNEAYKALIISKDELTRVITLIEQYSSDIPMAEANCKKLDNDYHNALNEYSIEDNEWQEYTKNYSKTQGLDFIAEFEEFGKKKSAIIGSIETSESLIKGKEYPDLESIEEKISELDARINEVDAELKSVEKTFDNNKRVHKSLVDKKTKNAKLVYQFAMYEKLYKRFHGDVTGQKMDIETYVQRYYLERILSRANFYYRKMTNNEFELHMTSLEEAGDGSNKGLDLLSYSTVYHKANEISSLSGGETFMAALAIAIGMADQISMSSSISIDMMFIDEGFGSLSEVNRRRTVDMLKDLAKGNRLIGIISHVSELKTEIDDKLLITKDENGSHIKWDCV